MATEIAWLIEMDDGGCPTYWSRVDDEDGVCGWSKDHNKALRFCREQDAQAIIDENGWTEPRPVEHAWDDIPFRRFDTLPGLR